MSVRPARLVKFGSPLLVDPLRLEGRCARNRRRSEGLRGRPLRPEASEVFVEQKRAYKSFHYKAKTTWSSARRGMLAAAGRPNIVVGSPPEFKGEPDIWAPEELLVGSLNTCMMLTFLTLAQAQGLTPVGYESEAEGLLAKPWKASKPTASSQIPLTPGSRSSRSLSLLPRQSENVLPIERTRNRL